MYMHTRIVYMGMCYVYIRHKPNVSPSSPLTSLCWFYNIDFVTYSRPGERHRSLYKSHKGRVAELLVHFRPISWCVLQARASSGKTS